MFSIFFNKRKILILNFITIFLHDKLFYFIIRIEDIPFRFKAFIIRSAEEIVIKIFVKLVPANEVILFLLSPLMVIRGLLKRFNC